MKKIVQILLTAFATTSCFALDINAVFDNQKKAAFPDTAEIIMQTTVTLPGMASQTVRTSILTAGSDKSITTVKSQMMNIQIVKNGDIIRVTDLKTGKSLPSQSGLQNEPTDITSQMGKPEDYRIPVKENGLWKIVPKDDSKPVFFYSDKKRRVVKMIAKIPMNALGGVATAETEYRYCDNSCQLPGSLSSVEIKTLMPNAQVSNVKVDVLSAKRRSNLPTVLFNIK